MNAYSFQGRQVFKKLTMSTCNVTCPDPHDAADTLRWQTISPNPDVSGIGVWLRILILPFAI